jgi:hypothetical protein
MRTLNNRGTGNYWSSQASLGVYCDVQSAGRNQLFYAAFLACDWTSHRTVDRHFEEALNAAKGVEPPDGPKTPLRKDGEI